MSVLLGAEERDKSSIGHLVWVCLNIYTWRHVIGATGIRLVVFHVILLRGAHNWAPTESASLHKAIV